MTEDALISKVPGVLQSCTMSEEIQLGSCNETSVMSTNIAHEFIRIKVEEEDIDVDTKEQLIPMSVSCCPIKAEQDEVSYVSLCPFFDTFPQYAEMATVICCLHLTVQQPLCGE
jgi:hypothetical protein